MKVIDDRRSSVRTAGVSLILPQTSAKPITEQVVALYRRILDEAGVRCVEIIIVGSRLDPAFDRETEECDAEDRAAGRAIYVSGEAGDWPSLVRAGLDRATSDCLIVLDVSRHYPPQSLVQVMNRVRSSEFDLAVAVPARLGSGMSGWARYRLGPTLLSRVMLGTSDAFSGLFALRRAVWNRQEERRPLRGSSLVLESLLRKQARSVDVAVTVDSRFVTGRIGISDLRPVKGILDARFGNYSRLVQFCLVGASGMVIDLSSYALLQSLLSHTWLAQRQSALFGSTWHMTIAAALSIAIALLWNFALNRRLTFNDAQRGAVVRQFATYVLSNAVAIFLSFSVRLFLPTHVEFFARHRLAAAVVGIVAATGISFSMARWLVFVSRKDLNISAPFPIDQSTVGQTSTSS